MTNKPTHPHDEQLSAFCDGEIARDEVRFLLRRLDNDAEARQRFASYHLIGAALRGEATTTAGADFAASVMARLDDDAAASPVARTLPWLKAGFGGLIAAGVAAVALVAIAPPAGNPTAGVPTLANATGLRNEDLSQGVPLQRVTERQSFSVPVQGQAVMATDPRVESYFLRHSGATWASARGGYAPYVYVVATPRASQEQARSANGAQ